jgi:hypothetical protein
MPNKNRVTSLFALSVSFSEVEANQVTETDRDEWALNNFVELHAISSRRPYELPSWYVQVFGCDNGEQGGFQAISTAHVLSIPVGSLPPTLPGRRH